MANLSGKPRADYVKSMFSQIALQYDRANRWMTWGQDVRWRREVLDRAALPVGGKLLDIGTGTGDLALEAIRRDSTASVVGADFTPQMMDLGCKRPGGGAIKWLNADALDLPLNSGFFDVVVSGYLLRNVIDVERVLFEQHRVLKPGGRMVCLDSTPLPSDIWHFPSRMYVRYIVPIIGQLIAGDGAAYTYLPQSTQRFLTAESLAVLIARVGFNGVSYRRFMGGAMAIHQAIK